MNKRTNRLHSCNFKQQVLLDFTLTINTNLKAAELLEKFEDLLRENLGIGKLVLYTHNISWKPILVSGVDRKEYDNLDVEKEFIGKIDVDKAGTYMNPATNDFDVVIPVYQEGVPLAFLLIGDINSQKQGLSPTIKHMKFIQILTNIVVVSIEKNRQYMLNLEREIAFKEMELASKVQNILIPDLAVVEQFDKLNIEGFYMPHFVVGGDYYDVFPLSNDELVFCVADVSGKGISAALLLSGFQANLKAIFASHVYLTDVAILLNEKIFNIVNGEKFITMFIAVFNNKTNQLKYINAGHNPPILYNKKTKKTTYLSEGCVGLGMVESIEVIEEQSLTIEDNSKLLCYTDGLIEFIVEGTIYTYNKEVENYYCTDNTSKESIDTIVKEMHINESNNKIFDDITMLGVDFNVDNQ